MRHAPRTLIMSLFSSAVPAFLPTSVILPSWRFLACFLLLTNGLSFSNMAVAAPVHAAFFKRDSGGSSSKVAIWVPVVVVVLFVTALAVLTLNRHGLRRSWATMANGAAQASGAMTGVSAPTTREVTAEQLIGRPAPAATLNTTRNPRRPGRTASQMSTRSLPKYMEEPGDQELIIYRGPLETEDVTEANEHEHEPENAQRQPHDNANDDTGITVYPPTPLSAPDTPFLHEERHVSSRQNLLPPPDMARGSLDSMAESEEESNAALLSGNQNDNNNNGHDHRGEAPPYTERDEGQPDSHTVENANVDSGRRRSGFRSLLNAMSTHPHRGTSPSTSPATSRISRHAREGSGGSDDGGRGASGRRSHAHSRSGSNENGGRGGTIRATHRPNQSSGSGSMLNNFRNLSRTRSNNTLNSNHLTSPSTLSLNSISHPLTHTVMRTEIVYPKSGFPTPEQVRLISSRESLGRFGVPYGEEAVKWASNSRLDLGAPPDFDFDSAAAAAAATERPRTGHSHAESGSGEGSGSGESLPRAEGEQERDGVENDGEVVAVREEGQQDVAQDVSQEVPQESRQESQPAIPPQEDLDGSASSAPGEPSSKIEGLPVTAEPHAETIPLPESETTTPTLTANKGLLQISTTSLPPPVSSKPSNSSRTQSRASSSYYATAEEEESMRMQTPSSTDGTFATAETPTSVSVETPRVRSMHLQEGTDATIVPDAIAGLAH